MVCPAAATCAQDFRRLHRVLADREEDRLGAVGRQRGQYGRRVVRPRTVVEGQHHFAGTQEIVALEVLEAEARPAGGIDLDDAGEAKCIRIAGAGRGSGRRRRGRGRKRLEPGRPAGMATVAGWCRLRAAQPRPALRPTAAKGLSLTTGFAAGVATASWSASAMVRGAGATLADTDGVDGCVTFWASTAPNTARQTTTASAQTAATSRMVLPKSKLLPSRMCRRRPSRAPIRSGHKEINRPPSQDNPGSHPGVRCKTLPPGWQRARKGQRISLVNSATYCPRHHVGGGRAEFCQPHHRITEWPLAGRGGKHDVAIEWRVHRIESTAPARSAP